ncbi:MAG: rhodanese-like domain-containing protein [Chloroflexi bacterium]|nr:rhodanese-like domain-containing protein [Chloroflexota bacterium]
MMLFLLVLLASLAAGCAGKVESTGGVTGQQIQNIGTEETLALIQQNRNNNDFVVLDVRTPEEFNSGRLSGAVNIDFYSSTFADELDRLDKDKVYLVYCRTGQRSAKAVNLMKELGFTRVYNMLGGIVQWQSQGFPTSK